MKCVEQWRANPNLDLNPDLATFPKSSGFGFGLDLYIFYESDLDLDLDLDLNIAGFAHHWLIALIMDSCQISKNNTRHSD